VFLTFCVYHVSVHTHPPPYPVLCKLKQRRPLDAPLSFWVPPTSMLYSPKTISEPVDSSAGVPTAVGRTSSSKLMRSKSPGGLAGGPSPSDLNALAWDATESRGGTGPGFGGAEGWAGGSEDTDFLGSRGLGAGIGTFFPTSGFSNPGPPPEIS
jgi:hypothetical protein